MKFKTPEGNHFLSLAILLEKEGLKLNNELNKGNREIEDVLIYRKDMIEFSENAMSYVEDYIKKIKENIDGNE